jgi:outer membrane protein assembly factor BamB
MMRKNVLGKIASVTIILIFIGTSIVPIIQGITEKKDMSDQLDTSSTDWWPMFHHDLTHSGYSTSYGPESNTILWTFQTETLILASPTVVDGKVFIGSGNKYYCLDADTGEKLWELPSIGWSDGNPSYEDGKLYLLSRDQYGENKIFCVNAENGEYIWNFTDCYWPFNPVVFNGCVFFGALDGFVRCLNAENGNLLWSFSTNSVGTSNAPAISEGKVLIGAENGKMYCLNASNGDELWNFSTNGKIMECASIADRKVYFGSVDWNVYCLNIEDGQLFWTYTTSYYVDSTPAIAYGKVYIGSRDQTLYCLDADTGAGVWSYTANGQVDSSPAVADGKVYFGSDDSMVYCLDAQTGVKQWEYPTGSFVMSSPAIARGKLYIGSYDTNVYCFGGSLVADFTWSPPSPAHGQVITFDASASHDPNENNITLYEWDWDNNGVYEESSTTPVTTHQWADPGSYPVTLQVTNTIDQTATVTKTVSIGNQPPDKPIITGPTWGVTEENYTFTLNISDPDGDTLYCLLNFGDSNQSDWIGPFSSGATITVSHAWTLNGSYDITAILKDSYDQYSDWAHHPFNVYTMKKAFLFGKITNLTSQENLTSFDAVRTHLILFAPFSSTTYISGETLTILSKYFGKLIITNRAIYLIAFCTIVL